MAKTFARSTPGLRVWHFFTKEDNMAYMRMWGGRTEGHGWYQATMEGFRFIDAGEEDDALEAIFAEHGEAS